MEGHAQRAQQLHTATAATTVAATAAAARAWGLRLINADGAAHELGLIQRLDGLISTAGHGHKRKATGAGMGKESMEAEQNRSQCGLLLNDNGIRHNHTPTDSPEP
jgi:hypothetical protein